jgi:cation diffusion facilitator CzcD-associated flavoprotein CzcO
MQRIAFIGGGPAGVSAALELLRIRGSSSSSSSTAAPLYAPTLFERRRAPGGVWTYEEPQAQRICFDETGQAHAVARTMDGAWPPAGMFEGLRCVCCSRSDSLVLTPAAVPTSPRT